MKYIIALFCIVAFVSGSAVELQSTQVVCACRGLLNKMLKTIEQQEGAIKQTNQDLDAVEKQIDELDGKVDNQGDRLVDAESQLQVLLLLQNHTLSALDEQNDTFSNIVSVLGDLYNNMDGALQGAEEQASIMESLLEVAANADDCTNGQCKRQ